MIDTNGYLGFTFAGHHSSEFGLLVVSDGSRYHQNLFSSFNDTVTSVPGKSGGYYFGTQLGMRDFDIECVFDNITTHTRNKIQEWLYPNRVSWLVFDEMPYKKYLVKVSQIPNFSYIPFDKYLQKGNYNLRQDILKGELSISFFSFEEYGIENEKYEIPSVVENQLVGQEVIDSGLIPENYKNFKNELKIFFSQTKRTLNENENFYIYNAGNGIAKPDFYFSVGTNIFDDGKPIIFYNYEDGQSYIINDFTKEYNTSNDSYFIELLGSKNEIWVNIKDEQNKTNKINIGAYYNQYFPKIYHKKSTEIMFVTQSEEEENVIEPLFYSYSYYDKEFQPSDSNKTLDFFEDFSSNLSDYILCTKRGFYEINDVLTPSVLSVYLNGENSRPIEANSLAYFIYPNKFNINKEILNFTPIYSNTYI